MAQCRCDEKEECKIKIERIQNAISSLGNVDARLGQIKENLSDVAQNTEAAYDTSNKSNVIQIINTLDEDMKSAKSSCENVLTDALAKLEELYGELYVEDETYHNELAQAEEENEET